MCLIISSSWQLLLDSYPRLMSLSRYVAYQKHYLFGTVIFTINITTSKQKIGQRRVKCINDVILRDRERKNGVQIVQITQVILTISLFTSKFSNCDCFPIYKYFTSWKGYCYLNEPYAFLSWVFVFLIIKLFYLGKNISVVSNWIWVSRFLMQAGLALGELKSMGDLYDFNSVATLFLIGVVSVTPTLMSKNES